MRPDVVQQETAPTMLEEFPWQLFSRGELQAFVRLGTIVVEIRLC
jgi:hypothetical protein